MAETLSFTPSGSSGSGSGSWSQSSASRAGRDGKDGKVAKREQVAAACLQCRGKKVKCDAIRPSCMRCHTRRLQCVYDVADENTTKLEDAKRKHEEVQGQLEGMRELYGYLATRAETEATQILFLIRAHPEDPFAVLRAIQEADLLLRRAAGARSDQNQKAPQ